MTLDQFVEGSWDNDGLMIWCESFPRLPSMGDSDNVSCPSGSFFNICTGNKI